MIVETLSPENKAIILDEFIKKVQKHQGIYGYTQIFEILDNIAIQQHLVPCPYCKRK